MEEFTWAEDLGGPRVREVVDEASAKLRALLDDLPDGLYEEVLAELRRPRVARLAGLKRGVAVLFKALRDRVVSYPWRGEPTTLFEPPSGELATSIEGVDGELVAVRVSRAGADVGYTLLLDTSGKPLTRIDGDVSCLHVEGDSPVYVRLYREGEAPDGAPAPAFRVVGRPLREDGESLVWGSRVPSGRILRLRYLEKPGLYVVVESEGWG